MSDSKARQIAVLADKLFQSVERSNQETQWSLISEFVLPSQSGIFLGQNTPGEKKTRRLFDSTAIQANHDLAAAVHSTLTNPATQWSRMRFRDDDLNNDASAVRWLEDANRKLHLAFNESNFDTQVSKNYQAFTSLGTMALFHEEADHDDGPGFNGFNFQAWHLSEVAFAENKFGIVDTVYRKFRLTAKQAFERWDAKVSDEILKCLEKDPFKEFHFIHCIEPRDKKEVRLNEFGLATAKERPFASYYVDPKRGELLEESGYYEFPVYVTRWQTMPGEIYGRGPGHIALPEIRTLNKHIEIDLQFRAKAANPPILATQKAILGALDLRPGQLSIVRDPSGIRELVPQARADVTQIAVQDSRNQIKANFFIDKLMLPPRTETGEMTAFEIAQRMEQMQKVLGPTLSRLNNELLTPLIVRSFRMLLRGGALSELPPILEERGVDVEISFVNQLARSQQIEDVTNIQSWVQNLALLAQVKPEVVDYINADGIAKHTAKIQAVPEIAVTDDDQVEQIRQQRAQAQQQQQALEAGVQVADINSKIGEQ